MRPRLALTLFLLTLVLPACGERKNQPAQQNASASCTTQAPPEVEIPAGLLIDGSPATAPRQLRPGQRVHLRMGRHPAGQTLTLKDAQSGALWFEGPAGKLDLAWFPLRTRTQRLLASFSAAASEPAVSQELRLELDPSQAALYPGLLFQILRRSDPAPALPAADAFAPPATIRSPYLAPDYADYPPFRTAESIHTPDRSEIAKSWWMPPTYFHGVLPSLTIANDPKRIAGLGAIPKYPLDDIGAAFLIQARFSGELLVERAGDYQFKLECNLPARLEIGGQTAASDGTLKLALTECSAPLALTLANTKEAPQLDCRLLWQPPGASGFTAVPDSLLVHRVDAKREKALATLTKDFAHRQTTLARTFDDKSVAGSLGHPVDQASVENSESFVKSVTPYVQAFLSGKSLAGDPRVARAAFAIIRARIQFLRAHPEQLSQGGFCKTDGRMMRFFEGLRPLLSLAEAHPLLQQEALAARADLAAYATGTCLSRSFLSETHHGTNDGYGDDGNLLVNFWRGASVLDDPYAWDCAACLQDSHFRYAAGKADGVSTDGIFLFHNANGRHIHMSGYGANWYDRIAGGSRFGTPWGFAPEQYRRLAEYCLAYEWLYYQGTTPFTANGRHNGHAGSARELTGRLKRLLDLPAGALNPATRKQLEDCRQRVATLGENTLSGNRFFFRALYDVHRSKDYFIDVKMISPLVGGPETFAGAFPWNMSFGDGVTTLMRDGKEYANLHRNAPSASYAHLRGWKGETFEPKDLSLWRYRSLPGTTMLDDEVNAPDRYRGGSGSTAGGVSDGQLGHCAFRYVNGQVGTDAHKFYAFTPDGMMVLNSGVTTTRKAPLPEGVTMRSNLNQCDWRGDVTLISQDGHEKIIKPDSAGEQLRLPLDRRYWIQHDGIGYLILPTGSEAGPGKPGTLCLDLTERTPLTPVPGFQLPAKTADAIKANIPPTRVAKVFHLSIDHGPMVKDGKAAYFICMNDGAAHAKEWLAKPPLEILSSKNTLQALRDSRDGTVHAFFREAGELKVEGKLLFSTPTAASLMWRPATKSVTAQDPLAACTTDPAKMTDTLKATLGPGLQGLSNNTAIAIPLPGTADPDDRYRGQPVTRKLD